MDEEKYQEVSIQRSFYVFVEEILKPYYSRIKKEFNEFREVQLWEASVEVVFTMNEQAIQAIYKHYSTATQG